jgi:hypothetical protein
MITSVRFKYQKSLFHITNHVTSGRTNKHASNIQMTFAQTCHHQFLALPTAMVIFAELLHWRFESLFKNVLSDANSDFICTFFRALPVQT